jgi:hypothetical protein
MVSEYLNPQIEKGYFKKNVDVNAIACGLVSLFDGLSLSGLVGISNDSNKREHESKQSKLYLQV